ncbi:hypothetical protein PC119_g9528 [Phytophthora cactorum]|nr:hypothetical protein PC119_g9528 [Phytophthora cactorum]KAG3189612.1 hypothetical protein C6341_g2163 [Phytophthora cactorum]
MLRSKWREFFLIAEMEEMATLKAKGVIFKVPGEEVPEDALLVNTMWVYALKTDHYGIEPVVPGPWLPKVFDGTLPLLRFGQGTIVYVLVYVDDILVATNDEQYKNSLFAELNEAYGIKDQGLLSQYLGVEVKQTAEQITISQGKYAREILSKYGYENAHAVGNPMEVNVRLTSLEKPETADTGFPYREAIGMLMYLATSTRPDLAFAVGQLS